IAMGSIIGSGIFRTPSVVAQRAHVPWLMLIAWAVGGLVTLCGAFVLGELAARRPEGCGAYAYLRDAFHPIVAFAFGWTSLLVGFSGGIAAAAVLFAGYFQPLVGMHVAPGFLAATAIAVLTAINCLGLRAGSGTQNLLMLLKLGGIGAIVVAGVVAPSVHGGSAAAPMLGSTLAMLGAFSVAMIPVLFAYNGSIGASFITTETQGIGRNFPLGMWTGMLAVTIVYVAVNAVCLRVLGADGLAKTATPASDVLQLAAGPWGARLVALAIILSTLGYIGNRMLTAPRLYYAMAQDRLFFAQLASVDPRTRVPVVAIALQGVFAIALAVSGSYERILNYVVSTSYLFTGLLGIALFVIRARDGAAGILPPVPFRVPLHPVTTLVVIAVSWAVALATYVAYPTDGLIGLAVVFSAVPVYLYYARRRRVVLVQSKS
ncbi:MAG: amino acid permease, partial [Candidatus Eremiobacteraeota bacterium]|nr:amino acid permease [Candidatus Eremiobacteraeota bacterium]